MDTATLEATLSDRLADHAAPAGGKTDSTPEDARFFDSRQKYLLFVNTCNEKRQIAHRILAEAESLLPRPPAFRLFDAGVGDGSVLTQVLRGLHSRHPTVPMYVVGKEISVEDVRLTLDRLPDRFVEHPSLVMTLTNASYGEAPWLNVRSACAASTMIWEEIELAGTSAHEFESQLAALGPLLDDCWKSRTTPSGSSVPERPAVIVIYRRDQRLALDSVIPRRGAGVAHYDLVIASQPYRSRTTAEAKSHRVIAPLTRSLAPGGRLIGIHSSGDDPALELVRHVWPNEDPFPNGRHEILQATRAALGRQASEYRFHPGSEQRSRFRYAMHPLPGEGSGPLGTSTIFAAWNAATYVAQIDDARVSEAMRGTKYLEATRDVLRRHGMLWFLDESYVVSRVRR